MRIEPITSSGIATNNPLDGRVRAVVETITPSVDGGRFAAKRVVGDRVVVEADCFADGHDVIAVRLKWRRDNEKQHCNAAGCSRYARQSER